MKNESINRDKIIKSEGHGNILPDSKVRSVKNVQKFAGATKSGTSFLRATPSTHFSDIVKDPNKISYGVLTVKETFPVLNMSCASCAARVENVLKSQKGIVDARVNLASSLVSVEYISDEIDIDMMEKVVHNSGYELLTDKESISDDSIRSLHEEKILQLRKKTIRALLLSTPVVIIGMFFMNMPYANLIMWIFSTPVVVWYGRDFFINGFNQLKHRSANMDTLVAMSTGTAYLYSLFNTLFPQFWQSRGLTSHVYFEAAAVVITFILLGRLLEERAKDSTSSAIRKLIGLQPRHVTVIREDNKQIKIEIEHLVPEDIILVKPGEKIAVDGVVVSGESYVDESMLSGEPIPTLKKEGEKVFAGTINQKGSFKFRAIKVGRDTLLAQIIDMVKEAQGSKAPVQKMVDKVAAVFVPTVIAVAVVAFIAWIILGGENGFNHALLAFVTVLVIACPCALGLATPTAIMAGIGKGAESGILIKDAVSLETAKKIDAVIMDKTGTITIGKPVVTDELWLTDDSKDRVILSSIERISEHPVAEAVVSHLNLHDQLHIDKFNSITGKGVEAYFGGDFYFAGNQNFVVEKNIKIESEVADCAEKWRKEAKTVVWFCNDNSVIAILAVADQIKESSEKAVSKLRQAGIDVYMVTGDNKTTAEVISEQVGIRYFQAETLPDQKAEFVKQLQSQGKVVAMVGDGINDSAALAQADVGIAMGKGSDIAMDVAKMTIISSDLNRIYDAIGLSRDVVKTIKQNLFWAFIYNVIGIPIAAGILYPVNGFLINPMIAGAAMALSSVSVVTNSLRLKLKSF